MTATSPRTDVYSHVTSRIVAELEQGVPVAQAVE
jgi:antirestriction protein ArdC